MLEKRTPIRVADAVRKIMDKKLAGEKELVPIEECEGRFLAEDIRATHDVPHFDRSPYDGFALRSADTAGAGQDHPLEFEVIEELGAGMVPSKTVGPNQAVRIMTGAQLPDECDAVIMIELTKPFERDGRNYISFKRKVQQGENVSFRGEDAKEGDVIVKRGTKINPGVKAVLATFGYGDVPVAVKPRIGLFATGSELLEVREPLQPGKIRNSNAQMIIAQIRRAGGEPVYFGQLADHLEESYQAVAEAVQDVDLLITTGGVSVGDYDYLPDIYRKLGAEVLFNKVGMRPGSVTTVASLGDKILFGLSGNPSACYVGFELFARPIVRTMLFSDKPHLRLAQAELGADFTKANPFHRFVRSSLSFEDGRLIVIPSGKDKSNIVMSLAGADCLTVLPGGTRGFQKGDAVSILLLEDQKGSEWPWEVR